MQFNYRRFPSPASSSVDRPVIPITLRNPHEALTPAIGYHALVDSGSDRCIFSADVADLLGIDLKAAKTVVYIGGVVAGERQPIYMHPIEIEVGDLGGPRYLTMVGFMPDFSQNGLGLIGRIGFFNEFTFVKFKEADHLLDVGKRRR